LGQSLQDEMGLGEMTLGIYNRFFNADLSASKNKGLMFWFDVLV